ncbi:MAG: arylsulfatase A-like enzyme, partial [Chlamydiales bacterium]
DWCPHLDWVCGDHSATGSVSTSEQDALLVAKEPVYVVPIDAVRHTAHPGGVKGVASATVAAVIRYPFRNHGIDKGRKVTVRTGVKLSMLGVWTGVTLGLASSLAGCSAKPEGPPNVVMIVLDTTRPSFTSVYGAPEPTTPFLETLAAAGTRFERAYSSSSWTLPAHGTLFTGMHPKIHRCNQTHLQVNEELPLLAEELGKAGYQTAAFSGNVWVSERSGLATGFETFHNLSTGIYLPHVESLAGDREGRSIPPEDHYVANKVISWLRNGRDLSRPFFLFVNLVEPHMPYVPYLDVATEFLESPDDRWNAIQKYFPDAMETRLLRRHYGERKPLSEAEWDLLRRMYRGEIRVVDDLARVIVEAVDQVSDPARTLCFVLSDHGENLGDHGHMTHILNVYDSNLRIVLLARGPGFGAGVSETGLVGIQDIYPTVLGAAGITVGDHIRGVDLRTRIPNDRVLTAALEYPAVSLQLFPAQRVAVGRYKRFQNELDAAIGPRFKLIRTIQPGTGEAEETLFDLLSDPDELRPLPIEEADPEVLTRLRRALALTRAEASVRPATEDGAWDDEQALEDMRAMGYIGGDD